MLKLRGHFSEETANPSNEAGRSHKWAEKWPVAFPE